MLRDVLTLRCAESGISIPCSVLGYHIGCGLAGWMFDRLEPLRRHAIGWVFTAFVCMALTFAGVGVVMALLDEQLSIWPDIFAVSSLAGGFAAVGTALWLLARRAVAFLRRTPEHSVPPDV